MPPGISSTMYLYLNFNHLIELNDLLNGYAVNSSNRFFKVPKWEVKAYLLKYKYLNAKHLKSQVSTLAN